MGFSKDLGLMLYVNDVKKEKEFWSAAGFEIVDEQEMMGYIYFTMKTNVNSTTSITVYDKEFIRQVSPEVIDMVPSILFETDDIETLQKKISALTDTCSEINEQPFPNFNFACPSGMYFAVKGN